jgi:iron complex transport system substrate-binding protein
VFAAPKNTTTASGRAAPHQFLFNRTTGVEGVLSLQGSLFLGNSLRRHTELAQKLRAVGEPAVVVDDLQPAPDKVRKIAAALGLADAGQTLARQVQQQLDEAAAIGKASGRAPRVIHVSATGAGGAPTVAGADSASAKLIALAGGLNIGTEAGVSNYSALSNEGVVAAAPEVILVTEHDLALFGGADGLWKAYPTLKQTPAGQANRVWVMPDVQLKYASVGSGVGALALAKALAALPKA